MIDLWCYYADQKTILSGPTISGKGPTDWSYILSYDRPFKSPFVLSNNDTQGIRLVVEGAGMLPTRRMHITAYAPNELLHNILGAKPCGTAGDSINDVDHLYMLYTVGSGKSSLRVVSSFCRNASGLIIVHLWWSRLYATLTELGRGDIY